MSLRYYLQEGWHSVGNWRQVCCRRLFIVCLCSFGSSETSKIRLKTLTHTFAFGFVVSVAQNERLHATQTATTYTFITHIQFIARTSAKVLEPHKKMQLLHFLSPISVLRRLSALCSPVSLVASEFTDHGINRERCALPSERYAIRTSNRQRKKSNENKRK